MIQSTLDWFQFGCRSLVRKKRDSTHSGVLIVETPKRIRIELEDIFTNIKTTTTSSVITVVCPGVLLTS